MSEKYPNILRILFGPAEGHEELVGHLGECLALCEEASGGPWWFDSYSRVKSQAQVLLHREWSRAHAAELAWLVNAMPSEVDPEGPSSERWVELARTEPETTVCQVPAVSGDTATKQAYVDALLISMARTLLPILLRRFLNESEKGEFGEKDAQVGLINDRLREERDELLAKVGRGGPAGDSVP